jgi:hypothetical protein
MKNEPVEVELFAETWKLIRAAARDLPATLFEAEHQIKNHIMHSQRAERRAREAKPSLYLRYTPILEMHAHT